MRLLIIGSRYPEVSGTVVSLNHLIDSLERDERCELDVIDCGRISQWGGFGGRLRFFPLLVRIARSVRRCDIICPHLSPNALVYLGPFLVLFSRVLNKPILFRLFGGMHYGDLEKAWKNRITHWFVRRTALYLAQTKELLARAAADQITRVEWFPTSRPVPGVTATRPLANSECRRFIFVGQMKRAKGVLQIMEAAKHLPVGCSVALYGPLNWDLTAGDISGHSNVTYGGALKPSEVKEVIRSGDVLLLPSYMDGEGYPGVIIEAYSQGRPVIVTRWKALPEIVDEGKTGLIVEPRDSTALLNAMTQVSGDAVLYQQLCKGAWDKRLEFSSVAARDRYLSACRQV